MSDTQHEDILTTYRSGDTILESACVCRWTPNKNWGNRKYEADVLLLKDQRITLVYKDTFNVYVCNVAGSIWVRKRNDIEPRNIIYLNVMDNKYGEPDVWYSGQESIRKMCRCELTLVMNRGCQCGGK